MDVHLRDGQVLDYIVKTMAFRKSSEKSFL